MQTVTAIDDNPLKGMRAGIDHDRPSLLDKGSSLFAIH